MTRDEAKALLERLNPSSPADVLALYLDAWADYTAAQKNIDEHGAIVLHPRTGAPIENPYLKVRASAIVTIDKLARHELSTDPLWGRAVPASRMTSGSRTLGDLVARDPERCAKLSKLSGRALLELVGGRPPAPAEIAACAVLRIPPAWWELDV